MIYPTDYADPYENMTKDPCDICEYVYMGAYCIEHCPYDDGKNRIKDKMTNEQAIEYFKKM